MESFEALFRRYFERVYRFALSLTRDANEAEDLTQQTFFKALRKIDTFEGRSDPATWLCSIAKNEFFSGRKRAREMSFSPDAQVFDGEGEQVEQTLEHRENVMRIHRALHELIEPYREVFMLRVFGELKYAQIAALFNRTESWARVTYYRAKCELERRIGGEEDE